MFSSKVCDSNTILEVGIELGVLDVSSSDEYHEIYCNKDDFAEIRESLVLKFNDPIEANVICDRIETAPVANCDYIVSRALGPLCNLLKYSKRHRKKEGK